MASTRDVLSALWKLAASHRETHNVVVRYILPPPGTNLYGYFHPDARRKPRDDTRPIRSINICRRPVPYPSDVPASDREIRDSCILAHEYGHFLSWLENEEGTTPRWRAYFQAACARDGGDDLSDEQTALIHDEETLAWEHARRVLGSLGFDERDDFEACVREGLDREGSA